MRIAARAAFLLTVPLLAGVARSEETESPWRSAPTLEKRLAEACDAVEKACGAAFEKRPSIRISTADEIEGLVREELAPLLRAAGREDGLDLAVGIAREGLVAKYDHEAHAIHVVPDNVVRNAEQTHEPLVATEDGLRAVLAHEVAHALDFQRFPLIASRTAATSLDELEAWGAVVEGHAQLVAEQVALATGLSEAFQAFTRSITALPDLPDEGSRVLARAVAARLAFAYVAGLDFMKAVHAARGREGVEAALREPPKSRRAIENPGEWLNPAGKRPSLDVEGALAALGPWFEDPSWSLDTDTVLRSVLATQLTSLAPERQAALTAGFDSGAVVVAFDPAASTRVIGAVFAFRTADLAADFLAAERTISESRDTASLPGGAKVRDPKYADGVGAGGKRRGFVAEKTVEAGDEKVATISHFCLAGSAVIEIAVIGSAHDRARQDAGVDAVAAVLEGTAPAPKPLQRRVPEIEPPSLVFPGGENLPSLRVLVVDPDGKPVPRARVTIKGHLPGRPGGTQSQSTGAVGGRVTLPRPPGKVTVSVEDPRGADRSRLDLGPRLDVAVPEGAKEMTIRLERALTIEGTVVDPDGNPVAGVVVEVEPDDLHRYTRFAEDAEDSLARSGPDGSFRLGRMGPDEVPIVARPAPGLAPGAAVRAKGGATGVRVAMVRGTEVHLRIVDPEGTPVSGATVAVRRVTVVSTPGGGTSTSWDTVAEVRTGEHGELHVPGIAPAARYDLEITPPSASPLTELKVESWSPASGTHALPMGFTVEGEVRDEAGRPLRDMRVSVGVGRGATTGADGRFRVDGVPRRPVEVFVYDQRRRAKVASATATPDEPRVLLTMGELKAPSTVHVDVVEVPLATPESPASVVVTIEGGDGRVLIVRREGTEDAKWEREIGDDGGVQLTAMDPDGTYVLWVAPQPLGRPGDDTSLLRRGVRIDKEPIYLALEKGKPVRGRFSAPRVTYTEVAARSPEGFVVPGSVQPDGNYEIRGLPPGTRWTVKAKARGESAWLYASAEAEAGAEVDLTLAPK